MKMSYKKLWKLLIDKGMTRTDLRKAAGISSSSLAKLGKDKNVTTDVLLRIYYTPRSGQGESPDPMKWTGRRCRPQGVDRPGLSGSQQGGIMTEGREKGGKAKANRHEQESVQQGRNCGTRRKPVHPSGQRQADFIHKGIQGKVLAGIQRRKDTGRNRERMWL